MEVDRPDPNEADVVAAMWVALAGEQRPHGSHLLGAENRARVRAAVARCVVADEVLVARRDGDPVGFVWFEVETGTYAQDVTRGIVRNIYVAPAHRDAGAGGDLLAAAEDRLRAAGADVLALEVLADNEAARRFYRRHGYGAHRLELEKSADEHASGDERADEEWAGDDRADEEGAGDERVDEPGTGDEGADGTGIDDPRRRSPESDTP